MAPAVRGELGRGHAGGGRAHGQVPRQWGPPLRSHPHAHSKPFLLKIEKIKLTVYIQYKTLLFKIWSYSA